MRNSPEGGTATSVEPKKKEVKKAPKAEPKQNLSKIVDLIDRAEENKRQNKVQRWDKEALQAEKIMIAKEDDLAEKTGNSPKTRKYKHTAATSKINDTTTGGILNSKDTWEGTDKRKARKSRVDKFDWEHESGETTPGVMLSSLKEGQTETDEIENFIPKDSPQTREKIAKIKKEIDEAFIKGPDEKDNDDNIPPTEPDPEPINPTSNDGGALASPELDQAEIDRLLGIANFENPLPTPREKTPEVRPAANVEVPATKEKKPRTPKRSARVKATFDSIPETKYSEKKEEEISKFQPAPDLRDTDKVEEIMKSVNIPLTKPESIDEERKKIATREKPTLNKLAEALEKNRTDSLAAGEGSPSHLREKREAALAEVKKEYEEKRNKEKVVIQKEREGIVPEEVSRISKEKRLRLLKDALGKEPIPTSEKAWIKMKAMIEGFNKFAKDFWHMATVIGDQINTRERKFFRTIENWFEQKPQTKEPAKKDVAPEPVIEEKPETKTVVTNAFEVANEKSIEPIESSTIRFANNLEYKTFPAETKPTITVTKTKTEIKIEHPEFKKPETPAAVTPEKAKTPENKTEGVIEEKSEVPLMIRNKDGSVEVKNVPIVQQKLRYLITERENLARNGKIKAGLFGGKLRKERMLVSALHLLQETNKISAESLSKKLYDQYKMKGSKVDFQTVIDNMVGGIVKKEKKGGRGRTLSQLKKEGIK